MRTSELRIFQFDSTDSLFVYHPGALRAAIFSAFFRLHRRLRTVETAAITAFRFSCQRQFDLNTSLLRRDDQDLAPTLKTTASLICIDLAHLAGFEQPQADGRQAVARQL